MLFGIVRFSISILLLPVIVIEIDRNTTAIVVVLIPPAVDAGEPPIIIILSITKIADTPISPISTVLKPAVLVVKIC